MPVFGVVCFSKVKFGCNGYIYIYIYTYDDDDDDDDNDWIKQVY